MEADPPALILARNRRAMRGTSRELSRAYAKGTLVRVRHGIYYSKAAWISIKAWERYAVTTAAVASGDPSAVFCYLTGLRLWRLPVPGVPGHIHILTASPHKAGRHASTTTAAKDPKTGVTGLKNVSSYGIARHHWTADVVQRRGFAVTSLIQTVTDSIVRMELPEAVAVVDEVLSARRQEGDRLTRDEVKRAAALITSATKRSRVLEVLALADETAESVGESRSRVLIHVLGLPAPVLQQSFHDAEGFVARADFFWREYGVIGEFDGDAKYLDDALLGGNSIRLAILAEKKREDRLRSLGYIVVRWDWTAVTDPRSLARTRRRGSQPGNPRRMVYSPRQYRGNRPHDGDCRPS
ncbi:hypothetical protein [Arthrobacter pascens]|uniref:hypothetical protein n=1 Tax=Arthrobacter pascens TaxID=1677 RepID=UPI0027D8E687|nr:hypothetical protein [Arthrobacter pascens]